MNEDKLMKAIIYTRVSTKEQVEGYSLTYQQSLCREYAEKQGWEVIEMFEEQGESAKTTDRTQLLNLLEYCNKNKGKIDILLVHKLDRVSRVSADYHGIRGALMKYGIILRSVTETINETSQGKFMENIYAAVAQLDNDVRAERTKAGLQEKVKQGLWAWGAPLGYKNTPMGLVVDKEKARYIRLAFETYARGDKSIKDIASMFNKLGVKTKSGNRMSPQSITNMFNNKLYIGKIEVKDWGDEVDGVHEKIIDHSLFYKVKAIRDGLSSTAVPRLVNNPDFPLKNILMCECGKYLTASKSKGRTKRYSYYHCTCGKTRVGKAQLEDMFFEFIKNIQPNNEFRKLFSEILLDVWRMKQQSVFIELRKLEQEITRLKDMKQHLIEKNLQGIIDDSDYKEQVSTLNDRLAIKEVERSEIRTEETNIDNLVTLSEQLFSTVSSVWLEASFRDKLKFQTLLFPRGMFYKDGNIGTTTLGLPFSLIDNAALEKTSIVSREGFEPTTKSLKGSCSTTELTALE